MFLLDIRLLVPPPQSYVDGLLECDPPLRLEKTHIPLADASADVVYTSHSLVPDGEFELAA